MGKGVKAVYELYKKTGAENVTLKLYEGGRHELLNDSYKGQVIADLLGWLNENLKKNKKSVDFKVHALLICFINSSSCSMKIL